jgi:hypothetical protein
MKTWLIIALAAIVGIAVGMGTAVVRQRSIPWDPSLLRVNGQVPQTAKSVPQPKVAFDAAEFDFGVMDSNGTDRHDFVLKNVGDAPLILTKGSTSCKCTISEVNEKPIPPGSASKVTVQWSGKGNLGEFEQTANILTNDPARPQITLTINGRLTTAVRLDPADLVFTRITAGEKAQGKFRVYGYLAEPFHITEYKLDNPKFAGLFAFHARPLSPEQLKEDQDAKAGCEVEVTIKPGLPVGPLREKIVLSTAYSSHPTVELPVSGRVSSEIAIVGRGWAEENGLLELGTVNGRVGGQYTLSLFASGPHHAEIKYGPVELDPDLLDVLRVDLGPTAPVNDGAMSRTTLTITIPPGSPPANHLGSDTGKLGQIKIKTSHPNVPMLRILVRFAVEG